MWIRDRLSLHMITQTDKSVKLSGKYLLIALGIGTLISLGTVSYTHLRAHETVLDLVCRFLLEKKNAPLTYPLPYSSTDQTA